ncbi:MAG TPA: FAD:protein FMN transferase [Solirubrobacteraceae bacterium]|jgi:thiamine biosynthesis lipoprotein ApbE|nr:FAD:protein FMN transferase [Solirubrobacteraceae bacterium]
MATARWEALGTGVVLRVADPLWLPRASAILTRELDAIDRACSRFRPDSDLMRVSSRAGGRPVAVAPLLIEALAVALRAAALTDGDVDPTLGATLVLVETGIRVEDACRPAAAGGECPPASVGYDSDWAQLRSAVGGEPGREARGCSADVPAPTVLAQWRGGHRMVELDAALCTVRVPRGIMLDLGATAKAWAADRGARAIHEAAGCGVLVGVGGDIATAGPAPLEGWRIHVTDDHRSGPDAPGQTIAISGGGLATSSVAVRRWRRGGRTLHHIIDPSSGAPARGPWRTVSVAAGDCTDANIAATAALVRGERAPAWLDRQGLPARLVAHGGEVQRTGTWPE